MTEERFIGIPFKLLFKGGTLPNVIKIVLGLIICVILLISHIGFEYDNPFYYRSLALIALLSMGAGGEYFDRKSGLRKDDFKDF
jgi:hypothetical protein